MALLPGGATKQWLGLVLNVRYWHLADIDVDAEQAQPYLSRTSLLAGVVKRDDAKTSLVGVSVNFEQRLVVAIILTGAGL